MPLELEYGERVFWSSDVMDFRCETIYFFKEFLTAPEAVPQLDVLVVVVLTVEQGSHTNGECWRAPARNDDS
jgi:hypothetical protein